jgi:hypothetical protein
MYNFGILSFWSFNIKFKVISKLPNSKKMSPFDFKFKFQNPGWIWKSFQHESCRSWNYEDFIFWEFLSCYMFFKVISKNSFKSRNLGGGLLQCSGESEPGSRRHGRRRAAMAFHGLLAYPSWPVQVRAPSRGRVKLPGHLFKEVPSSFSFFCHRRQAPPCR